MKLLNKTDFIIQSSAKHNNRYSYEDCHFPVKLTDTIVVTDPEYGKFQVKVNKHLNGQGHPTYSRLKATNAIKLDVTDFIARANKVHENYFDYSKVEYKNMKSKVCIIDPIHGEFWQTPMGHLQGQGHPKDRYTKMADKHRRTTDEFIKLAKEKHGDLYDYTKVEYIHCDKKVCIIDPEYGEFWQTPYQHLNSHGNPQRTKAKRITTHKDHKIPLSILRTPTKSKDKWFMQRPLYKFLDSPCNLVEVSAKCNLDKSDLININGKIVNASTVRNNYDIIAFLIRTVLNIDPTPIIADDKNFVNSYFGIL